MNESDSIVIQPILVQPGIVVSDSIPTVAPTLAEILKQIMKADVRNHGLKLADIVGIYPAL
jgi:hypothetical protein